MTWRDSHCAHYEDGGDVQEEPNGFKGRGQMMAVPSGHQSSMWAVAKHHQGLQ